MIKNCKNCGGRVTFSPKDKGAVCENCATVYPIDYNFDFAKKSFSEHDKLADDGFSKELKNIRCESCGASVVMGKLQIQAKCPYCGESNLISNDLNKLMKVDSIIPFCFDKTEALQKFKSALKNRFYSNKKLFKNITEQDIQGVYVNAIVFDFDTSSTYSGVLSYTVKEKNSKGEESSKTCYKQVNGIFDKNFKNLTIEANSNIEQKEFEYILPFNYASAVDFQQDFLQGYMLEYKDKMLDACITEAEKVMKKDIERELLKKYNCDHVESLQLTINYTEQKYNYCLLPVYFITAKDNKTNKKHTVVMNGQTGKVGKTPSDKLKVALTAISSILLLAAFVFLIVYLVI